MEWTFKVQLTNSFAVQQFYFRKFSRAHLILVKAEFSDFALSKSLSAPHPQNRLSIPLGSPTGWDYVNHWSEPMAASWDFINWAVYYFYTLWCCQAVPAGAKVNMEDLDQALGRKSRDANI